MQIRSSRRFRRDRQMYSASQTRRYRLHDETDHLIALPGWRWTLLEQRVKAEHSSMEAFLSHLWRLAEIPSEVNPSAPTADEIFPGEIEDMIDRWHASRPPKANEDRVIYRRRPANRNARPPAVERVEKAKQDVARSRAAAALKLDPLPPVDIQQLSPAVAAAFATLFQKQ